MSDAALSKRSLIKVLSHPVLGAMGILGSIASLISIPLAVYFYTVTNQYPQLTYYVHPVRAVVVRAGQASKLTASYENKVIDTDITAVQVAIWNQGKQSIKRAQILKPLVLSTEDGSPILEATVRKERRDVSELELNTADLQRGRLGISWNILEQDDGCVIQLMYAGGPDIRLNLSGVIEGQQQMQKLESSEKIRTPEEQYRSSATGNRALGVLNLSLGSLWTVVFVVLFIRSRRTLRRGEYLQIIPGLLFMAVGIYFLLRSVPGPPFGF